MNVRTSVQMATTAAPPAHLDPENPVPLYHQLRTILANAIETAQWKKGDTIPSERILQETYGVSRATVRQAIAELVNEGYLRRRQGVGTVVASPKIRPEIAKLTSFTEDTQSRGLVPGSKTLRLELTRPSKKVAEKLRLGRDDKVWKVKRLRYADDEPIGLHTLYVPTTLGIAPDMIRDMRSYYELLEERYGLTLHSAHETLTATAAGKYEAEILSIERGAPLLVVERTTHTLEETPVEFVRIVYRADRYEYHAILYR